MISQPFIRGVLPDLFDRTIGDVKLLENNTVVVHGQTNQNGMVCGRSEYSTGQHRLRFRIEQWNGNETFSCDIISKNISLESLWQASNCNQMSLDYQYS